MRPFFLGDFLLAEGVITPQQLEEGLRYKKEHTPLLGDLAVETGMMTPEQVKSLNRAQLATSKVFGELAVQAGMLKKNQLDELLFLQKVRTVYLGEALLVCGHISRDEYSALLKRYYTLSSEQQINARYVNERFAENCILNATASALAKIWERFVDPAIKIAEVGTPTPTLPAGVMVIMESTITRHGPCFCSVVFTDKTYPYMLEQLDQRGQLERSCRGFGNELLDVLGCYFSEALEENGMTLECMHPVTLVNQPEQATVDCLPMELRSKDAVRVLFETVSGSIEVRLVCSISE